MEDFEPRRKQSLTVPRTTATGATGATTARIAIAIRFQVGEHSTFGTMSQRREIPFPRDPDLLTPKPEPMYEYGVAEGGEEVPGPSWPSWPAWAPPQPLPAQQGIALDFGQTPGQAPGQAEESLQIAACSGNALSMWTDNEIDMEDNLKVEPMSPSSVIDDDCLIEEVFPNAAVDTPGPLPPLPLLPPPPPPPPPTDNDDCLIEEVYPAGDFGVKMELDSALLPLLPPPPPPLLIDDDDDCLIEEAIPTADFDIKRELDDAPGSSPPLPPIPLPPPPPLLLDDEDDDDDDVVSFEISRSRLSQVMEREGGGHVKVSFEVSRAHLREVTKRLPAQEDAVPAAQESRESAREKLRLINRRETGLPPKPSTTPATASSLEDSRARLCKLMANRQQASRPRSPQCITLDNSQDGFAEAERSEVRRETWFRPPEPIVLEGSQDGQASDGQDLEIKREAWLLPPVDVEDSQDGQASASHFDSSQYPEVKREENWLPQPNDDGSQDGHGCTQVAGIKREASSPEEIAQDLFYNGQEGGGQSLGREVKREAHSPQNVASGLAEVKLEPGGHNDSKGPALWHQAIKVEPMAPELEVRPKVEAVVKQEQPDVKPNVGTAIKTEAKHSLNLKKELFEDEEMTRRHLFHQSERLAFDESEEEEEEAPLEDRDEDAVVAPTRSTTLHPMASAISSMNLNVDPAQLAQLNQRPVVALVRLSPQQIERPRDSGETREIRESRHHRVSRETREVRYHHRETREAREVRGVQEAQEVRENREVRQARENRVATPPAMPKRKEHQPPSADDGAVTLQQRGHDAKRPPSQRDGTMPPKKRRRTSSSSTVSSSASSVSLLSPRSPMSPISPRSPVSRVRSHKYAPESPTSSPDDGDRRKRVAHKPPPGFLDNSGVPSAPSPAKRADQRRKSSGYGSLDYERAEEPADREQLHTIKHSRTSASCSAPAPVPSTSREQKKLAASTSSEGRSALEQSFRTKYSAKAELDQRPRDPRRLAQAAQAAQAKQEERPRDGNAEANRTKSLRVLPPASHPGHPALSSNFESRSPLFVEDDTPRKSYGSQVSDSSEKSASRPVSQSWLDKVLIAICRWKPEWLQESKRASSNKVPDVLPGGKAQEYQVSKTSSHFSSHEEYIEYFSNCLLFDLWDSVSLSYRITRRDERILAAVDQVWEMPLLGNRKKKTFFCHGGISDTRHETLKPGDLVILNWDEGTTEKSFFGYIPKPAKTKLLSNSIKLSEKIESLCGDSLYKSNFQICLYVDDLPSNPETIDILKIRNVYEEIEAFKFILSDFVNDFALSNMAPLLCKPSYTKKEDTRVCLRTGDDLISVQKDIIPSLLQDILNYEAPSINVVEGGPGTGKTYLVSALAQELVERKPKKDRECRVIIAAKSNAQLDNITALLLKRQKRLYQDKDARNKDPNAFRLVRLGNENHLKGDDDVKNMTLRKLAEKHMREQRCQPLYAKRNSIMKEIAQKERILTKFNNKNFSGPHDGTPSRCAQLKQELVLLEEQIRKKAEPQFNGIKEAEQSILLGADILVTTVSYSRKGQAVDVLAKDRQRRRVVLIIDDASEVTEPAVLKLICVFGITDLVLFGDPKQHDPFVPSRWARNAGLAVPLMVRYNAALFESDCIITAPRKLTKQIRMPPEILKGPNEHIYNGEMISRQSSVLKPYLGLRSYLWLNCTYFGETKKHQETEEEADFIVKFVSAIERVTKKKSVRLKIVSFSRKILSILEHNAHISACCEKPENLAGMECDILVLSCGPSLKSSHRNKLPVALTRARGSLFMVGNFSNVDSDFPPVMMSLLKDARKEHLLEDITTESFSEEEILSIIETK